MASVIVDTIAQGYRDVHQQLREAIQGLDATALSWVPGSDTNSAQVLIVHLLGSEAEVLRVVAGVPTDRDRPQEFRTERLTAADLLMRLDAADALLGELAPRITQQHLEAVLARGDRPTQTGLHWLVTNYGHAREHLAHLQLSQQLYGQRR